jgi:hypothetical protein
MWPDKGNSGRGCGPTLLSDAHQSICELNLAIALSRLMPKADLDVLRGIACAFAAKIFPSFVAVGFVNIRVRIACPRISVLVDNGPVILRHFAGPAMRVGIVDAGKNLVGALDVEIAALLDLIGASSGYAGLALNNKQAAAPFIAAR